MVKTALGQEEQPGKMVGTVKWQNVKTVNRQEKLLWDGEKTLEKWEKQAAITDKKWD